VHAVLPTEQGVAVGGAFTHVKGQERGRLALVDAASGVPATWDPALTGGTGQVSALCAAGGTLFR